MIYNAGAYNWTITNNDVTNANGYGIHYHNGTPAEISGNDFTGSTYGLFLSGANGTSGAPFTLTWQGAASGPNQNTFGGHTSYALSIASSNYIDVSGWDFPSLYNNPATQRGLTLSSVGYSNFSNNNLSGFQHGIYVSGSSYSTVIDNNNIGNSNSHAIFMQNAGVYNWTITNNNITNANGYAIHYQSGTPADISGNDFTGSTGGLHLQSASNYALQSNTFDVTGTSVSLQYCNNTTISGIQSDGDGGTGINVYQSNGTVIDGVTSCGRGMGIRIYGSSNNTQIVNCQIANAGTGIRLDNTAVQNTVIDGIDFYGNSTDISDGGYNTIITNTQQALQATWCPAPPNALPVANAGTDQTIQATAATADVTLDGSSSSDPDGDALTYSWSGSFGTVSGATPTVSLSVGTHTITLTVDDSISGTSTDDVIITVLEPLNQPPVANAGTDQSFDCVVGSVDVTFDGSGSSDPDGDVLTYSWSGSFGTVTGVNASVSLRDGTHIITLTVADGNAATSSDELTVSIVTDNTAPVITLLGDNPVVIPRFIAFGDPGANVTDECDASPSLTIIGTVNMNTIGTYELTYTATDAANLSASVTRVVEVVNLDPIASAGDDQAFDCIAETADVTLDGSGSSDPDGDTLTYTWSGPFGTVEGMSAIVSLGNGTHSVTLTVDDGFGGTSSDEMTVMVVLDETAPVITLAGDNPMDVVAGYEFTDPGAIVEDDCDTDPMLSVDGSVDPEVVGVYTLTYAASDYSSNTSSEVRTVNVVNTAPVVANEVGNQTISYGNTELSLQLDISNVFADADGHELLITMTNDNDNAATALLTGNMLDINAVDLGNSTITLTADDSYGGSVSYNFTVTVDVVSDLANAILFALDNIEIKKDSELYSGNILVNRAFENSDEDDDDDDDDEDEDDHGHGGGHGNNDDNENDDDDDYEFQLVINKDVVTAEGYSVKADRIQIKEDAEISGDVYYNNLDNDGDINGSEITPLALPLVATLPPFKSAPSGNSDVDVDDDDTETLDAGDYDEIEVDDDVTLILTGGVYNIHSLKLDKRASLLFTGPTEIRIEDDVEMKRNSFSGPQTDSGVSAAEIIFYIAGVENAVKLEKNSDFYGTLYAPNGKVSLKQNVDFTGAILAQTVTIDKNAELTLASFFGGIDLLSRDEELYVNPNDSVIPVTFNLMQNYPNPFNPVTTIGYDITLDGYVSLKVFDLQGRQVDELVSSYQNAGHYQIRFDASALSSGTYLYVLESNQNRIVGKMVYLK